MKNFDLSGISHITQDSREVRQGSLFAALKGEKVDSVQFIPQAEQQGAVAVLCAEDATLPNTKLRVIRAKEPRLALSQIAAQFYAKQPEHIVAVTGTDGKTSTADFFRQLMYLTGHASAAIGTLGVFDGQGKKRFDGTHTTPDAIKLHEVFAALADENITHVCMEASSHGLDQYRMHGVILEAAAFTNIARDHLDYHKTEADYFAAKMKLFSEVLPEGKTAIINADDAKADVVKNICRKRNQRIIDFGWKADGFKILAHTPTATGQKLEVELLGARHTIEIPLAGAFQAMNILAAIGLAHACGESLEKLLAAIPKLKGVPGRLEHVATAKNGAAIYVDYAHTPAALANILTTLRPHTQGKLHVVFGCGGNRDAGKRPEMGKAANDLADVVIVTDDNPRNEDPATIRKAIMAACPRGKEVADRKAAIYAAVAALSSGDVLVIAGKGHETVQIISGVEHHFSDAEVARQAVI